MLKTINFLSEIDTTFLLYKSSIIVTLTVICVISIYYLSLFLTKKLKNTKKFWYKAIFISIKTPLITLITFIGLINLVDTFDNVLMLHLLEDFSILKKLLGVMFVSWFIFNIIEKVEEHYLLKKNSKSRIDQTTIDSLTKVARITTGILFCVFSMQALGFNINALVAFAGGGGVIAGFAAKDLLSNLFGALSIYLDRPFVVGDWIRSPDKDIEGIVEHIGLRITKIRNLDKRPLYIQNAIFNTLSIENLSNMTHRKIEEKITLNYTSVNSLDKITSSIGKMLDKNDDICKDTLRVVNLESFDSKKASILLMSYTKKVTFAEFCKFKEKLLQKTSEIINKEGGEFIQSEPAPKSLSKL